VPVFYYALTKAQSESVQGVQKRAIHIIYNSTCKIPYLSKLFYVNLNSLASRTENLYHDFSAVLQSLPLVSTVSLFHPDTQ